MRAIYCGVILLLLSSSEVLRGQNFVPNESFEDYNQLPCLVNNGVLQKFLKNWFQPITSSGDYFNDLAPDICFYNPKRIGIVPRTGHGMIGLITALTANGALAQYREYAEVKLSQPLKKGHFYKGEFYVYNGNSLSKNIVLSSNNMGIAFSDTLIMESTDVTKDHLSLPTQILSKEVIRATGQWEKIEGCFVADKAYTYLLIGNFSNINTISLEGSFSVTALPNYAYYLVDDVSVVELPYDVASLKNEIDFCYNSDHVLVDSDVPGAISYLWSNGNKASNLVVNSKADGVYDVDITFNECVYSHEFAVKFIPDIELGLDTILCREEALILHPKHPLENFLWSDGSTDSVKTISETGIYWVSVPSTCVVRDTISVRFVDCPGAVPNVFTPNDDGFNQTFEVENILTRKWSLTVYNRWGEQVFFSKEYKNDWDGKSLVAGVYYYFLSCQEPNKKLQGWVQIIK